MHSCDERCSCCPDCYLATGVEICSRLCPHRDEDEAEVEAAEVRE